MKALALPMLLLPLITTACGEITLGPRATRDVYWERLGTPAKVIQRSEIEVLVRTEKGEEVPAKTRADGMWIIDAPTYELYRQAWLEKQGKQ